MAVVLLVTLALGADAADLSSKAGAVTTSATRLNVRSAPSSGSSVKATLKKGSYITLIKKSGTWWKVEYAKGKYGYCHADYITVVQGTAVSVSTASGALNIRKGPGTTYEKMGSISKGQTVLLLTEKGNWSRILYEGTKTGYVSSQYLSGYFPAVSLKVPNWKQTDARWAEKTIGDSGKTFAQIGCATTAIAMMESYRTGKTLYPDAMARSLDYTPSGNVYWPSHFKVTTSSKNYLSVIYQKLKLGKPVLLGATTAQGSQHWVVITGFAGGSSLSASGFSIHDPGSSSRTNLRQFLNQYPNFYKYFHY